MTSNQCRAYSASRRRVPGAWVLLARGRPAVYLASRGRRILTFPTTVRDEEGALEAAIDRLRHLPLGGRRSLLVIETIDGVAATDSPLLERFREAGYGLDYRGLIDVRPPGASAVRRLRGR